MHARLGNEEGEGSILKIEVIRKALVSSQERPELITFQII